MRKLSQIKESNFRIMGILVDLRELCERSEIYYVVVRQTNINSDDLGITIKLKD